MMTEELHRCGGGPVCLPFLAGETPMGLILCWPVLLPADRALSPNVAGRKGEAALGLMERRRPRTNVRSAFILQSRTLRSLSPEEARLREE